MVFERGYAMSSDRKGPVCARHIHFSPEQEAGLAEESFGEKLKVVIDSLPPEGVTLADIRDLFGRDGLMLLTAFLTIPFMVPVSIPGVSTVFGAAILLIGISRFWGRHLWLPKRLEDRVLPADKLRAALHQGLKLFHQLERLTRPRRLKQLTSDGITESLNNGALILGALLLMAPFGFVPFSNTLPGLALLLFAIGLLQRDGVFILCGHLVNFVTIIYFAFLVAGGTALIHKIIEHFRG
ncbi:MAG TPA: exopolysaccharide biosynthesis protein [Candidatus Omnitrophota bacterium]|nr:exopolysaccharide biosynthesis protein [Candidatus Omnitrophota bacterium]HQO58693.1 exopolysaccharide biosynthesis protein [Candidatus Omnitrophota bacterium]HQP11751.1 exopolysaccharide biosynthesis protein [Candidatus Omnitrophota bacterium]